MEYHANVLMEVLQNILNNMQHIHSSNQVRHSNPSYKAPIEFGYVHTVQRPPLREARHAHQKIVLPQSPASQTEGPDYIAVKTDEPDQKASTRLQRERPSPRLPPCVTRSAHGSIPGRPLFFLLFPPASIFFFSRTLVSPHRGHSTRASLPSPDAGISPPAAPPW